MFQREEEIDFGEYIEVCVGKTVFKNNKITIRSKAIYLSILNQIIPFDLEILLLEVFL